MHVHREISVVPIERIKPYENNPRNNAKAVKYVVNSIRDFGFNVPIVTDKDGVIITGHTRLLAAKELQMKEVPVIVLKDISEDQAKAYRLADNKTAEYADWDGKLLDIEKAALKLAKINLEDYGFKFDINKEMVKIDESEIMKELAGWYVPTNFFIIKFDEKDLPDLVQNGLIKQERIYINEKLDWKVRSVFMDWRQLKSMLKS